MDVTLIVLLVLSSMAYLGASLWAASLLTSFMLGRWTGRRGDKP